MEGVNDLLRFWTKLTEHMRVLVVLAVTMALIFCFIRISYAEDRVGYRTINETWLYALVSENGKYPIIAFVPRRASVFSEDRNTKQYIDKLNLEVVHVITQYGVEGLIPARDLSIIKRRAGNSNITFHGTYKLCRDIWCDTREPGTFWTVYPGETFSVTPRSENKDILEVLGREGKVTGYIRADEVTNGKGQNTIIMSDQRLPRYDIREIAVKSLTVSCSHDVFRTKGSKYTPNVEDIDKDAIRRVLQAFPMAQIVEGQEKEFRLEMNADVGGGNREEHFSILSINDKWKNSKFEMVVRFIFSCEFDEYGSTKLRYIDEVNIVKLEDGSSIQILRLHRYYRLSVPQFSIIRDRAGGPFLVSVNSGEQYNGALDSLTKIFDNDRHMAGYFLGKLNRTCLSDRERFCTRHRYGETLGWVNDQIDEWRNRAGRD